MNDVTDWHEELSVAIAAAREAGQAIARIRGEGFETYGKEDASPVTTADMAANGILKKGLLGRFGDDGWLSEESVDEPARLERRRCWIVDPLDGTKEFLQGIAEYCVSVALAVDGQPVVGVIYNPSTDQVYAAADGQGATLDDRPIHADHEPGAKPLIAASRSEVGKGKWQPLADRVDVRPAGSAAFKLALVAAGEVDGTFTMAPRNEWDIAAGVLLLREAGGIATDRAGEPLQFNQADPLKNGIFAATRAAADSVREVMRASLKANPLT